MALLRSSKQRASDKGFEYNLDFSWARSTWNGHCALTGLPFRCSDKNLGGNPFSPTIDRIDPKRGYVQDNCRFILFSINSFKHTGTDNDLKEIIVALNKAIGI